MAYSQGTNVGVTWGSGLTAASHSNTAWGVVSTSEGYSKEVTETPIKDRFGQVFGMVYSNNLEKLSLAVFPSDVNATVPFAGETLTLTSADTDLAGAWIVDSVSQNNKNEGIAEWSVECSRSYVMRDNNLINAED